MTSGTALFRQARDTLIEHRTDYERAVATFSWPRLQQRFAVQAIPTMMVLRDGKALARQDGAAPVTALRGWLDQSLAASAPAG